MRRFTRNKNAEFDSIQDNIIQKFLSSTVNGKTTRV